jgi:hypothetical protein
VPDAKGCCARPVEFNRIVAHQAEDEVNLIA